MKRAAIYCRVSTDEQAKHGYSIGAQLESLRKYAKENKYQIMGEYLDEGISARKSYRKRPALLSLLEAVKAEEIDTILFIKLDRWFRNVQSYYEVQPILEEHGVAWKATEEDYETETASGRFKVNIMLSVAQDEADRTSERIRFVFSAKKEKGEVVSGKVPLGVRIVDKHYAVDPETAPICRDLFRCYIDTRSRTATAKYMIRTYPQYAFCESGVANLIKNRRLLDLGVIPPEMFAKAQEICAERSHRQPAASGRVYLFSGLLRCAECGRAMKATCGNNGDNDHNRYLCSRRAQFGDRGCTHRRQITESKLENFLLDEIMPRAEQYNSDLSLKQKKPAVDKAGIRKKMEKLKDLYLNDLIQRDVYERDYRELQEKLDTIPVVERKFDVEGLADTVKLYPALDRKHKSAFWHRIIRDITVDNEGRIFFDMDVL